MLVIDYPGSDNGRYVKVVVWASIVHTVILSLLVAGAMVIARAKIRRPTTFFLGVAGFVVLFESRVRLRFFQKYMLSEKSGRRRHPNSKTPHMTNDA